MKLLAVNTNSSVRIIDNVMDTLNTSRYHSIGPTWSLWKNIQSLGCPSISVLLLQPAVANRGAQMIPDTVVRATMTQTYFRLVLICFNLWGNHAIITLAAVITTIINRETIPQYDKTWSFCNWSRSMAMYDIQLGLQLTCHPLTPVFDVTWP